MVEFCPKCGSVLVPEKRKNKAYLVCKKCGYSKPAGKKSGYKFIEQIPEEKKNKTPVITEEVVEREKIEEERELLREYYEVFLETMESEGGD